MIWRFLAAPSIRPLIVLSGCKVIEKNAFQRNKTKHFLPYLPIQDSNEDCKYESYHYTII